MRHLLLTTAIVLMTILSAAAQPPRGGERGGKRISGEIGAQLHSMQCKQIINALELEGEKSDKFREIYMAYNQAIMDLRTPPPARDEHGEKPSEEQIELMTLNSFDRSIKSMEIKKEYYMKFRDILKASEITEMYNLERKIRDRAIEELLIRGRNSDNGGGNRPRPHAFN